MAPDQDTLDVIIVGAGLSGIGAACHLRDECPDKTFAILEARDAVGGTWDLFRYPGIRSDSDMYTLGYSFRPWTDPKSIADGPSILEYINETAREYGVDKEVRFQHRVVHAEWSSDTSTWTVDVDRTDTGERVQFTANFILSCSGYYRYDEGYTPDFPGTENFKGRIVHPQHWPDDLDYAGKKVVVVGSGATAVTLVPAMADEAAHVTMLQRTPTYIVALPGRDPIATKLRRVPSRISAPILKWKNVLLTSFSFNLSRKRPEVMKKFIRKGLEKQLPAGYDIDTHFTPPYNPWDQRMCLVPDGDLFTVIRQGRASIVTDRIDTFTPNGLRLESGAELEADIVITATGLNMLAIGGMQLTVDGQEVTLSQTVGYKGMMFSGVPNLAVAVGYTNASWTLKCDLVCAHVCRLLNYMSQHGHTQVTPRYPGDELPDNPFIDLTSGYVLRSVHQFPRQGDAQPWRLYQNYLRDVRMLKRGPVVDDALEFTRAPARSQLVST